jgi:hypothetical protein
VIEKFAARNIPIRTIERVSGLIVTDQLSVGEEGVAWADCGKSSWSNRKKGRGSRLSPTHATYNVLVRGDSSHSSVKATVRWSYFVSLASSLECSTTHAWEGEFEDEIRARAEETRREYVAAVQLGGPQRPEPQPVTAGEPRPDPNPSPKPARSAATGSRKRPAPSAAAIPARLTRSNADLLRQSDFFLAADDCTRLGLISSYSESAYDTLTVELTDQAMTDPGTEFHLGRLLDGYRRTTGGNRSSILDLRHRGSKVGQFTVVGLTRGNWR